MRGTDAQGGGGGVGGELGSRCCEFVFLGLCSGKVLPFSHAFCWKEGCLLVVVVGEMGKLGDLVCVCGCAFILVVISLKEKEGKEKKKRGKGGF